MTIETYGNERRLRSAAMLLRGDNSLSEKNFILLPIPTTKDGQYIKGTSLRLDEALSTADESTLVVGYSLPDCFADEAKGLGAKVLDLSGDEKFLSENAHITAIGALIDIFSGETRAPRDTKIGIMGYGRIGKELVRLLLFAEGEVRVYTSSPSTCFSLCEFGIDALCVPRFGGEMLDTSDLDYFINTAPRDLSALLPKRPTSKLVELASGDNFCGIEGVKRLPSVPENILPESGGRAIFSAIKRYIRQSEERGG